MGVPLAAGATAHGGMSAAGSAGLATGGNILSNIAGFFLNRWQWKKANEYNHPKEHLNRLKEAGLNPNMMYASGGGGLQSDAPLGHDNKLGDLGSKGIAAAQQAQQMKLMQEQNDLIRAQVDKTDQETENLKKTGIGIDISNFRDQNQFDLDWGDSGDFGGIKGFSNKGYGLLRQNEVAGHTVVNWGLKNSILGEKEIQEKIKSKYFERNMLADIITQESLHALYAASTWKEKTQAMRNMSAIGVDKATINRLNAAADKDRHSMGVAERQLRINQQNADANTMRANTDADRVALGWANHEVYSLNSTVKRRLQQQDVNLRLPDEGWAIRKSWQAASHDYHRDVVNDYANLVLKLAMTGNYVKQLVNPFDWAKGLGSKSDGNSFWMMDDTGPGLNR